MIKIIQDYQDWKKTRWLLQKAKAEFGFYAKKFVVDCSDEEYIENRYRTNVYEISRARLDASNDNTVKFFKNIWDFYKPEDIKKYQAKSCLYKKGFEYNVHSCVGMKNPMFLCVGCPSRFKHNIFISLQNKVFIAQQKEKLAKQKLLDNLCFWKTK